MALYVKVFINEEMIITKACHRLTDEPDKVTGVHQYRTDCGRIIEHKYGDGAAVLAQKLLDLMKGTSLEDAKKLTEEFVKDLEKELGYDLVFRYIGSVARGEYIAGKSDVDVVILPGKNLPEKVDWGKACIAMLKNRDDKKYPQVFKKGRMTSIIDPMVIMNVDTVTTWRKELLEEEEKNDTTDGIALHE
jgi:predicted nucleotidyltransferase